MTGTFFRPRHILFLLAAFVMLPVARAERPLDTTPQFYPEQTAHDFCAFYEGLAADGTTPLVTRDSALWAAAVVKEQVQTALEIQALDTRMARMLAKLQNGLGDDGTTPVLIDRQGQGHPVPETLHPAWQRARDYVAVARALLDGTPPGGDINGEYQRVVAGTTVTASAVLPQNIDYRWMQPHARYTRNAELRRYYRARAWLTRVVFRFDEQLPLPDPVPPEYNDVNPFWLDGGDLLRAQEGDRDEILKIEATYPREGIEEMRVAGILSLVLREARLIDQEAPTDQWRNIQRALTDWHGDAPETSPVELMRGLDRVVEGIYTPGKTLAFLADDYDVTRWIIWTSSHVRKSSDFNGIQRRGFTFFECALPVDRQIFRLLTTSPDHLLVLKAEEPVFSAVEIGETQVRGMPAPVDLPAATRSESAQELLRLWNERAYHEFPKQESRAQQLWLNTERNTDPSVALLSLRVLALSSDHMQPKNPPHFITQKDHAFVRLNAALSFHAANNATWTDTEPVEPQKRTGGSTSGMALRGYLDPAGPVYEELEKMTDRMASIAARFPEVSPACIENARNVTHLLDRLATISIRQASLLEPVTSEDHILLTNWGQHLRHALTLPSGVGTKLTLPTPLPGTGLLSTQWQIAGQTLQHGTGAIWAMHTAAPVEGKEVPVVGAVWPFYALRSETANALSPGDWETAIQQGLSVAPNVLAETTTLREALAVPIPTAESPPPVE